MTIDRSKFFDSVRNDLFAGKMAQSQVDGLTRILDEWEKRGLVNMRWLGYMLATVYHETAHTMQPVREYGGEAYLRQKPYYPYVGEGLVQVTWKTNYAKFGATKPGDLLKWPDCLVPLFDGMAKGMFTGAKLSDYFNDKKEDPVHARKIINGLDKAAIIAGYYHKFMHALGVV